MITAVAGLTVGHAHDLEALTGVTVILTPAGAVGGVDVRGGAPGTRETDLLVPEAMVDQVHAVVLCGGSAFGLAAVTGVVQWLAEHGYGFETGVARVPIVPAAVLFDLALGRADRFPDAAMGYAACVDASTLVAEGCVGAGAGASVGKALGMTAAMKSGLGTASEILPDGTVVGALVAVNAYGDVWRDPVASHTPGGSVQLAGVRDRANGGLLSTMDLLRDPRFQPAFGSTQRDALGNTTLAVVATDARLSKAEARKLAQMAQDGLARTIRPIHTPFDGDTVFALATAQRPAPPMVMLGSIAADVLASAVERAVLMARSAGGLPSASL
ncbi:P1 family peptidase [Candidatus Chloroploca sp. M-50]|uniref:P1 family peptidase n=1 Tax=Candidatus Chloroploca mongolica TaxID=2528176 RepID=A0ABS4DD55_9CHLR|nr:P1 family peptidase [Candidatus Chloroploca mongolica]MBP1467249.1 P1 family peptidase [Candidatus Chloroploca mongolica]